MDEDSAIKGVSLYSLLVASNQYMPRLAYQPKLLYKTLSKDLLIPDVSCDELFVVLLIFEQIGVRQCIIVSEMLPLNGDLPRFVCKRNGRNLISRTR